MAARKQSPIKKGYQLAEEVRSKGAYGTYLLLGEEEADKDDFVSLVLSRMMDGNAVTSRFNLKTDTLLEAADQALSADMFQPAKCVIIREVDEVTRNTADTQMLRDMVANLPDTTVLILMTTATRVNSALTKIKDKIQCAIFWRKFENELASYISERVRTHNRSIEPDAVQLVLRLCGRNRSDIDEALHMLLDGSEGTLIDLSAAEELLTSTRETTVFECVDAIFEGRRDALIFCAGTLDSGTHELQLLALIARRLGQIETYRSKIAAGNFPDTVMTEFGIPKNQRPMFEHSARRFDRGRIRSVHRELYQAEKKLKRGGSRKNILANPIADLIYSIVT
ncbi:MAG: DNA polymerase III subunit delta [Spirochaetota bacterium]